MKVVTRWNYPFLYESFLNLDLDNGRINRYCPESEFYEVPDKYVPYLDAAERELSTLTEDQRNAFTTGEHEEILELVESRSLNNAHEVVSAYFNGWEVTV